MQENIKKINDKDIKYLNRDFGSFKDRLVDFIKSYYPETYNDFSEGSPGMMLVEMAAYVGDVLSLYQDTQLQETMLLYARERENLINLAYTLGYKPKVTSTSIVNLDVYQIVPSKIENTVVKPDFDYSLIVEKGMVVKTETKNNFDFITQREVDFSFSSSFDPTDITIYSTNGNTGQPEYYLLKKSVPAICGNIKTQEFSFGNPERYKNVSLSGENIIGLIDVVDSDNNKWYETNYLAEEYVFTDVRNIDINNTNTSPFYNDVPYILKLKKVPRRFVTRFKSDNKLEISFGAGGFGLDDEFIIPNPTNIGIGLVDGMLSNGNNILQQPYDSSNFLSSKTYGLIPNNTTLNIKYLTGGGIQSNVTSNTIKIIDEISLVNNNNLDVTLLKEVKKSIAVNNPEPARGGKDGDTNEEIRLKTLASFPTQSRAVTKEDYLVRALSLPSKYGSLAKAYVTNESLVRQNDLNFVNNNPLALNLYVLSYDINKRCVRTNKLLKENLKTYLSQFRISTDSLFIKDAYVVNITVKFDITVLPNFNSKEVLSNCIDTLTKYFEVDKWSINQPIIQSEVINLISQVKGVQSLIKLKFENISGLDLGYSVYGYDLHAATKNGVIYPSIDPCIFELKYPNKDIQGKITII